MVQLNKQDRCPWWCSGGVVLSSALSFIVKAVKMYRAKSEKEALEKSIQREEARKNREFKSTGGKRTGGNSWAAWDSNNLMA